MRILFLARSLDVGGAERQLAILARGLVREGCEVHVALFYGRGELESSLGGSGVALHHLGKRGRWDALSFLRRLVKLVASLGPDVVHGYLAVPNLCSAVLGILFPRIRIAWGVRASDMDLSRYDWLTRFTSWVEARLAFLADVVIVNSEAGRAHALRGGFPEAKIVVVRNGVSPDSFRFDAAGRKRLRAEWKATDGEHVVGIVGRLDPMKDHETFLRAAAAAAARWPRMRFVVVGDGPRPFRERLELLARSLGLEQRVHWAGGRSDVCAAFSAFDTATLTSITEGFPNAVGEAMACERPCVVTDVGDAAALVGETGLVVPARDPEALARAWGRVADLDEAARSALGIAARRRVESHFGVASLVRNTLAALGATPPPQPPV